MVLSIPKLIYNTVAKQAKISHQDDCKFIVFKKDEIPANIKSKIDEQYAEEFLEDANIVLFIKGPIDKKKIEKLFKCVDKALGEKANKLVEGDFKLLKMNKDEEDIPLTANDDSDEVPDQEIADIVNEPENEEVEPVADENDQAIADALASEPDESAEETPEEEVDKEEEDEEESAEDVDESLNEDDENVEGAAEEKPTLPTKYVFLKITLKK